MKKLGHVFVIFFVILAILGVFWFANRFGSGESVESEKPAVVCKKEECFWTAHMHAAIKVFKNGQEVPLQFEQGKLEAGHIHSERDKLHWHGLIPVDPDTKEVKDWSTLEVGRIPKDLNRNIEGEPKFIVNGNEVGPDYVWKDGDVIEIKY